MTWSAAQPEAALRVLRTAAGWRALQVALLLGGLLVIGLLCEERAYAESGVGALPEGRAVQAVSGVHVPGAAGGRLDRAAGDMEEAASEGVADARVKPLSPSLPSLPSFSRSQSSEQPSHAGRPEPSKKPSHPALPKPPSRPALPDLPELPNLPALQNLPVPADLPAAPSLPGLPDPPALPALPDLPGPHDSPPLPSLPGLPALPAPPGSDTALPGAPALPALPLPAPVTADPQPGGATTPVVDATGPRRQAGTPDTAAHGNEPHAAPAGPMAPGIHTHHVRHAHHTGHTSHSADLGHPAHPGRPGPSTHAGPTEADHRPGGRPGGALGNRPLADSGSSRHGDAHAVTPGLRVPLTLVAGLPARSDGAGARDSHRGVPLFPG